MQQSVLKMLFTKANDLSKRLSRPSSGTAHPNRN